MTISPLTRLAVGLTAAAVLASACGNDTTAPAPTTTVVATVDETTTTTADALAATYESLGNPDADIVVINTQGGPVPELAVDELSDVGAIVNLDDVLVVTVHQAQTIDPERFTTTDLSFDEAKAADAESVEMLAAVVDHFVGQGRTVYVLGVSFGAFMTQELLATQGNVADGYLIMVGRLDMPEAVWTEFAEGRTAGFVDGTEIIDVPIEEAGMGAPTPAGDRNMARLAAGLGHTRYTLTLAGIDLSNVIYAHGRTDEQVGRLTESEIAFLTAAGATVWPSDKGHGGAIDDHLRDGLARLLGQHALAADSSRSSPLAPPTPPSVSGEALLNLSYVGAVITADGVEHTFEHTGVEAGLDLGITDPDLAERVATRAVVGVNDDVVVALPIDPITDEPSGDVVLVDESGVAAGTVTDFGEPGGGFFTASGSVRRDDNGATQIAITLGLGVGTSTFEVDGTDAIVRGSLGSRAYEQVSHLLAAHPDVDTLVLHDIDGSVDDEINLQTARLVRDAGLDTRVPVDGAIYSGGVDLFAAGVRRIAEPGATLGVHAWCCGANGEGADEIPRDDPAHDAQLAYFTEMLGEELGPAFYFFTIDAAPYEGISLMTPEQLVEFGLVT